MGEPQPTPGPVLDSLGRLNDGLQRARFDYVDPSWRDEAACIGLTHLFFVGPGGAKGEGGQPGKAICADCPVSEPCLDYALTVRAGFGIWGGLTYKERTAYARRRRREAS